MKLPKLEVCNIDRTLIICACTSWPKEGVKSSHLKLFKNDLTFFSSFSCLWSITELKSIHY